MAKGLRWSVGKWDLFEEGTPVCYWYRGIVYRGVVTAPIPTYKLWRKDRPRIYVQFEEPYRICKTDPVHPRHCRIDISKPEGRLRSKEWKKANFK